MTSSHWQSKNPRVKNKQRIPSQFIVEIHSQVRVTPPSLLKSTKKISCELFKIFQNHKVVKKMQSRTAFKAKIAEPHLTILFVSPARSRKLNRLYRKKDYATDVLSFSWGEDGLGLGELVLCLSVLKKQAREHKLTLQEEAHYLIIHGFLHLLGYDHEKSRKEELKMMALQDKLFEKLSKKGVS